MAINWEVKITAVNTETKRGDVIATRTDTVSAEEPQVYRLQNTPLETPQDRQLVLSTIKGYVVQKELQDSEVADFLSTLEQTAKVNLEQWEIDRVA